MLFHESFVKDQEKSGCVVQESARDYRWQCLPGDDGICD